MENDFEILRACYNFQVFNNFIYNVYKYQNRKTLYLKILNSNLNICCKIHFVVYCIIKHLTSNENKKE